MLASSIFRRSRHKYVHNISDGWYDFAYIICGCRARSRSPEKAMFAIIRLIRYDCQDARANKLKLELNIKIVTRCLARLQVGQEQRSAMLLPYTNLAPPLRPIHHSTNISNFDMRSVFMWSTRCEMTGDPIRKAQRSNQTKSMSAIKDTEQFTALT